MLWSLILPGVCAVHFNGLQMMGKSRFYAGNALHYQGSRYVRESVRNSFSQPNHYNWNGKSAGYTRKVRRTSAIHFDGKYGKPIGWSRCLLVVWFHKSKNGGIYMSKYITQKDIEREWTRKKADEMYKLFEVVRQNIDAIITMLDEILLHEEKFLSDESA